jgi:hypothetical protein
MKNFKNMKTLKIILIAFFATCTFQLTAQTADTIEAKKNAYKVVEKKAEFNGGNKASCKFLKKLVL